MDSLSSSDKVALARQFNLIVRAINDYQVTNWTKLGEKDFNILIKKEREILHFVERLLESSAPIQFDELYLLVEDLEGFSKGFPLKLKSNLPKTPNLTSKSHSLHHQF